ncbi:lipase family protein [Chondromyces apiculatus]|uniref:Secretory lipase n=1 Tax=Chondromyces apiculatus DSM 436 TaxID=1192034 RepID=A0A017SX12_9BACT|nr:lipase family protein [Chondromyces apiculatus]EYF01130.1 Hypothetical protein CAP_8635 [Chondromyces apiculatus DSM 436]
MQLLRSRLPLVLTLLSGAAILSACEDDGSEVSTTSTSTTTTTSSSSGGGEGGEGGTGGTGGSGGEGGGVAAWDFPAPVVAGTPETDAVADAPARCGQPAHTWLRDADLGRIVAHEDLGSYPAALLAVLAQQAVGELPVELEYDVDLHLVTYMTQDRGVPLEATTLVAWPKNVPAGTAELPTLLLLHGTTGFRDGCGPSEEQEWGGLAAVLASAGYVVVSPDYIGLKAREPETGFLHPYLVGQATAIASLDAVRIFGSWPEELRVGGAVPSPNLVVVGGSQGGHAALWVDRLAPYYARELSLTGIAATVPPADLVGQAELALTQLRPSTGNMVAFFGASAGWYGAGDRLDEVLVSPLDTQVPETMESSATCEIDGALGQPTTLNQIFQQPFLTAAQGGNFEALEPWGCMGSENGLTTTSIARLQDDPESYGILFVTGQADTLVDTPNERAAFETLCSGGIPMQYLECAGASHTDATFESMPEILTFLQARQNGTPFEAVCTAGAAVTCMGAQ